MLIVAQPGPYTGFLTRVSADGSALLYSTYLGGNNSEPAGLAIDGLGEVFVAGYTQSPNFPVMNADQQAHSPTKAEFMELTAFSRNSAPVDLRSFTPPISPATRTWKRAGAAGFRLSVKFPRSQQIQTETLTLPEQPTLITFR